jgi:hypothetical protein
MADFGDLIVVIPGIFGSRLEREDGTLLYDLTLAGLPRTLWTLADQRAAPPFGDRPPADGVVATDLFNYQLLPGFFGNDDYGALVDTLRGIVKDPDRQVITFPYDWRASNRWAAEDLERVARGALSAWRRSSGNADAKLWLVCHSMGGLVARYFCEHLGGADITRVLITLGTPHRGAARALEVLVNGMRLAGLIDISSFVRSLPSVYELLPHYPVLRPVPSEPGGDTGPAFRLFDAYGLGERLPVPGRAKPAAGGVPSNWNGLPNLDRRMLERAVEFHAAIREPVVKRMDAEAPAPYAIRCFINRRQPTILSTILHEGGRLEASTADPLTEPEAAPDPANRGDGTVAAFSAVPIEWNDTSAAVAVAAKHVGMPASKPVLEALRNWLLPLDARAYMGGGAEADRAILGLQAPSAIRQGDRLVIEVDALQGANVTVSLKPLGGLGSGKCPMSRRAHVPGNGQPRSIDLGAPTPGAWLLTVEPEDRRRPAVSDYVFVLAVD